MAVQETFEAVSEGGRPPEPAVPTVVIQPTRGLAALQLRALWEYRELLYFLVWRDVKVRYKQTALGVAWIVLQPVISTVVFTLLFGILLNVPSGGVPYPVFALAGLVPWSYFSGSLTRSSTSLVGSSHLISKVYFPRLIIPVAPVLARLLDFVIALGLLAAMLLAFRIVPTPWALALPLLTLPMILFAAGLGSLLTALAVRYRDVKYGIGLLVQLLMYASPVVYPASLVPPQLRLLYGLIPMAGVIEGYRAALLGTTPMPWDLIAVGSASAVVIAIAGTRYFGRMERFFADVA
jgi:lipopolysaccharide transport system permease protein